MALEVGYQRQLAHQLIQAGDEIPAPHDIDVQAAFCIDVRSDPLRRALEAVWPGIQTLGFAGFFGLPVAYTPLASQARRPQLPGLLAPTIEVTDRVMSAARTGSADDGTLQDDASRARQSRLALADRWQSASRWPGAALSYFNSGM